MEEKKINWKPFDLGAFELKAGMLVKVFCREIEGVFLVGHVNRILGTCDDCQQFYETDIKEYSDDYVEEFEKLTHFKFLDRECKDGIADDKTE